MFQQPRPTSNAPSNSYFTPSAATPTQAMPFATHTHSSGGHHIVAVPLGGSSMHRPIAITRPMGGGTGSGPNSASHGRLTARLQQNDSSTYSPSTSASASPAVYGLSQPGTAVGVGFSLSTPSPPLANGEQHQAPMPASPMISPSSFFDRRDSVDENEAACASLQGVLWRHAPLRNPPTVRHSLTQSSPSRSVLSPHGSVSVGASQAGSFSRAIPIAKRAPPLQVSILNQMQSDDSSHAQAAAHASREGSRRGSASGSAAQSSFVGTPLVGTPFGTTPLGTSYVLSQTPPVRAGNPLERDQCFSPGQQAQVLHRYGEDGDGGKPMLPMMLAAGYANAKFGHSPVLSTLSMSLAHRQSQPPRTSLTAKFGSPHLAHVHSPSQPVGFMLHQTYPVPDEDVSALPKLSTTC